MADASTTTMLGLYESPKIVPSGFLSLCSKKNFKTDSFQLDIVRDDASISVVVDNIDGANVVEQSLYKNKEFTPPIYRDRMPISAASATKRQPGNTPYADLNFQANLSAIALKGMGKLEERLVRAMELQASQVFQTGSLSLLDATGATKFTMSFSPKGTHFVTPSTWSSAAAGAMADIGDLAEVILRDSNVLPTKLLFGRTARRYFEANTGIKSNLDKTVLNYGALSQTVNKPGEPIKFGVIVIEGVVFELYSYDGFYKHPQTGTNTPYLATNKVVMFSDFTEVVAATGAVTTFDMPDDASQYVRLPGVISSSFGPEFSPMAWIAQDRSNMTIQLAARPLVVPVGIDTFGCLTVA